MLVVHLVYAVDEFGFHRVEDEDGGVGYILPSQLGEYFDDGVE